MIRSQKILILILLLAVPSFSAFATCAADFAALSDASVKSLRQRYAFFRDIGSQDNIAFRALAERANRGEKTEAKLFLDVENAVMKDLNDKIVKDKDVVTALVNFHKSVFWNALESDPLLSKALVGKYSDPKSLRLAFNSDSPELIEHLKAVYQQAGAAYEREILRLPDARQWFKNTRGLSTSAFNWHLSGYGSTPDIAGIVARDARTATPIGERAALQGFREVEANLVQRARNADVARAKIVARWAGVKGVLSQSGRGNYVLSFDAINTIRKATPRGTEDLIAAIQKDFEARFNVKPTISEAEDFREYLSSSDAFSPGIYVDRRVEIELGRAKHGIVSVDLKAQNARNIESTMMALADSEGAALPDRLVAVRAAEARVTAQLDKSKRNIASIGEEKGGTSLFTGDDGVYFPDHELTQSEKRTIVRRMAGRIGVDRTRLVFLSPSFVDSGREIPAEMRSEWIVAAEDAEKKTQKELLRIFGPRANQLTLAMDVRASESRRDLNIYVALPNGHKPSAMLLSETRRILSELGWNILSVQSP